MIPLTQLNRAKLWVSSDQIEFMESTPDTVLTMLSGKKVIVKETPEEIATAIANFRRRYRHSDVAVENQGIISGGVVTNVD